MVIPGGFTYSDDIAAGKVLANELRLKLGEDIPRFIEDGGLILEICNGFQVLVKAGILPGPADSSPPLLTLMTNDSGKFECRWVHLRVNKKSPCVFTPRELIVCIFPLPTQRERLSLAPGSYQS